MAGVAAVLEVGSWLGSRGHNHGVESRAEVIVIDPIAPDDGTAVGWKRPEAAPPTQLAVGTRPRAGCAHAAGQLLVPLWWIAMTPRHEVFGPVSRHRVARNAGRRCGFRPSAPWRLPMRMLNKTERGHGIRAVDA